MSERSKLATVLIWARDLAVVGLLIWFFATGQHARDFWNTAADWFNKGVAAVFSVLPKSQEKPAAPVSKAAANPQIPFFLPAPLPKPQQLAKQVPGDCFPPEAHSIQDVTATPEVSHPIPVPPPQSYLKVRKGKGQPIKFAKKTLRGVPFYLVTVDLTDPDAYLVVRLPNNAAQANSTTFTAGHETFDQFVKSYPAAVLVNGTFFSKDDQERVMGNLVSEGKSLKYSQWENYGTTLSLSRGDRPEMVTARVDGKPEWDKQWLSITCGPRLLKQGDVWVQPDVEGFTDSHVLGIGPRSAVGFPKKGDKLYFVTFLRGLSLEEEAKMMKAIGCYEAMNLDGGASKALSHNEAVVMKPGRGLTNVLVVYDSKFKAPESVASAWQHFQETTDQ